MNTLTRIFFIASIMAGALLVSSCVTLTNDIETKIHAAPDVDFSTYKTYAWVGSSQIVFDPVGQWEQPTLDTDEEVKFNINRELRNKGLFEVTSKPDRLRLNFSHALILNENSNFSRYPLLGLFIYE